MIFVTVGTHEQPFNRLIQKIDELKKDGIINEDVIIQTGFSTYEPKYCQWSKLIPYQQIVKNVADARIVITHGGPASFIMPLQIGKTPIVVPRQHQFNEHVNDHQVEFARNVAQRMGTIIPVEDINTLGDIITNYDQIVADMGHGMSSNNAKFNEKLEKLVDELCIEDGWMRKVGIMSMQRIANYGSFLQAYALKQLIEEVGCNVEFVDYHVGAPVIAENADSKNKIVRKIEKGLETFRYRAPLAHKLSFIRYKQSFARKYMPLLGIADEMNYNPTVDCLVIGSDEVFNCIQKNSNVGYSPELFGKNNHAKKLITYAASFGNTTLEKLEKYKKANEVGALLKKFDAISVRDANSGTIVEQLTGKEPVYNLDPVLTYDYMNCCDKIPQVQTNEKYLILYAYAGRISNDEADWIAAYAKKKNLKVYAIGGIQKCADRFVDCSPFEVLAYFRNAEEVITDTFHGSIFSVITHRPFTTLIRKSVGNSYGNEEKLSDLLKRLGLANRMTTKIEDTENINEKAIDYAKVDEQLKAHREVAKEYLRKNLEE